MSDLIRRVDVLEECVMNFGLRLQDIAQIPAVDAIEVANIRCTDKDAHWAELVLRAIEDLDCPMLMYAGEKEVVKKALTLLLNLWDGERKEAGGKEES